jgi:hypothetical protein
MNHFTKPLTCLLVLYLCCRGGVGQCRFIIDDFSARFRRPFKISLRSDRASSRPPILGFWEERDVHST